MIKKQIFVLMILTCWLCVSFAQSRDAMIDTVKKKYQFIRNNLNNCSRAVINLDTASTEGGQATAYSLGKKLLLIKVVYFGETGKEELKCYFDKEQLLFVVDKNHEYNRPIYWDKNHARETGDTAVFDYRKTVITEDRYYFYNGKLILWLDNNKKEVDLTTGTNTIEGQGLIAYAHRLRDRFKK